MKIIIRQEHQNDHETVFKLIQTAFAEAEFSDHREQFLVERLRNSQAFIPELSLVAEKDDALVGHILLTRIHIEHNHQRFDSLALAPVSVLPRYQGQGIGGCLIMEAHQRAKAMGHRSVVLLGHAAYYPKFGYRPAHEFGIELPFEVPKENCMAIELVDQGLALVQGRVVYPKEFEG
ncbi:N-acetyltransferase [Flagellimonas sp. DF-77]|uniref:GNAT family N-acetyltransferase n=1 Tax=Flagellimonas algarum TaxID=3230298 RepID=UPI003399A0F9